MEDLGDRLKRLRIEKEKTQKDLADALGVTAMAISGYERGTRHPSYEMLKALADYFDVSYDALLESDAVRRARQEERLAAYAAAFQAAEDKMREEEQAVIKAYRTASEDTKKAVRAVLGIEI
jgi:transcriptional regulator with XRE-family HTH domain